MMKPPVKPVAEGFKPAHDRTKHVAAPDCPVKQGENTLHQKIGTDAQGRLVVLCSNGKVRVIDPNEPHVLVPDPSQFDLAQWQATQRLAREDLAAKKELDAQVGRLLGALRKDWAIRIARGLHGIKDPDWDTQQKALKALVESGEARVLHQDKKCAYVALAKPYLDFEPVPAAPEQVIWMAGTSVGFGTAKLLGWFKGNPVVFRLARWDVEVAVVEGGVWTKPLSGDSDVWIAERLAEQADAARRIELKGALEALRGRLAVEISVRPKDDSERLLLDALEREGFVVCLDRDYVLNATNNNN